MKRTNFFCASPASTAICSSIDQRSMVRRSHKPIFESPRTSTSTTPHDHYNYHDHHRRIKNQSHDHHNHHVPCSSQLPINPRPHFEKSRKSTCSSYSSGNNYNKQASSEGRRKSSADALDLKSHRDNSSRYLLSESPSFVVDWLPESSDDLARHHDVVASEPAKPKFRSLSSNDSSALIRSSSSTRSRHQVVVLRVSLHCKGCEGKVRKHLSKMEGVTSFSIELEAKKVTVIGDVTPLGVLASVSKVKNAQLWPSPTSSSSPSSPWSA